MSLWRRFLYFLNGYFPLKKQTFTYFIPAPPVRKSGYREKSFDSLVQQLSQIGFKILDINTSTINDTERIGMWVVITVAPFTKEASLLDPSHFPKEFINMDQGQNQTENNIVTESEDLSKTIELPKDNIEEDEINGIYYID